MLLTQKAYDWLIKGIYTVRRYLLINNNKEENACIKKRRLITDRRKYDSTVKTYKNRKYRTFSMIQIYTTYLLFAIKFNAQLTAFKELE
jgi:hypothetical protein